MGDPPEPDQFPEREPEPEVERSRSGCLLPVLASCAAWGVIIGWFTHLQGLRDLSVGLLIGLVLGMLAG